jgi:hypothetical protein
MKEASVHDPTTYAALAIDDNPHRLWSRRMHRPIYRPITSNYGRLRPAHPHAHGPGYSRAHTGKARRKAHKARRERAIQAIRAGRSTHEQRRKMFMGLPFLTHMCSLLCSAFFSTLTDRSSRDFEIRRDAQMRRFWGPHDAGRALHSLDGCAAKHRPYGMTVMVPVAFCCHTLWVRNAPSYRGISVPRE